MTLNITNFENNPLLKELMINYYGIKYEMSATEDDMLAELYYMMKNDELANLFICETMSNEWKVNEID